ncbi:MAG: hypothetical protein E7460_07340 [Ruminococcaceae bacterium]|nr:hypothetical protein [Oscillospiraceae bacterium]
MDDGDVHLLFKSSKLVGQLFILGGKVGTVLVGGGEELVAVESERVAVVTGGSCGGSFGGGFGGSLGSGFGGGLGGCFSGGLGGLFGLGVAAGGKQADREKHYEKHREKSGVLFHQKIASFIIYGVSRIHIVILANKTVGVNTDLN